MEKMTARKKQYEKTHELIKKTALKLFAEKSVAEISIRDICNEAKVSIGTFYHHFESKKEIIDSSYDVFDQYANQEVSKVEFNSYHEKLEYLLYISLKIFKEQTDPLLVRNSLYAQDLFIFNPKRSFYQMISGCIEGLCSEYQIDSIPEVIMKNIIITLKGAVYQWYQEKCQFSLIEQGFLLVNIILAYYLNEENILKIPESVEFDFLHFKLTEL